MIYLTVVTIAIPFAFAVVINAMFRSHRAQQREMLRYQQELLNRIMFMADRPYVEPPIQEERPRREFKEEDEVYMPEARVAEYN